MMVATAARMSTNKKVYICFITALTMLAASPMRADSASQKTLVVRADRRTGKTGSQRRSGENFFGGADLAVDQHFRNGGESRAR
jgi:hypothetical protein